MKNEFQYRLQKAIAEKGITASELSRVSGVGKADISNYINGVYVAKQDKCYLLAEALGVDPGWLMTGEEPTTKDILTKAFKEYYKEYGIPEPDTPQTPEARILAKGIDKMPEEQRKALMTLMTGLYPGLFESEKGTDTDDT